MRLSKETLQRLPQSIARPNYDRAQQTRGIVHFGLGAFTRAHQIAFTHDAMNGGDEGWMVTGISMRSASVRESLQPQDGLYMIAVQGAEGTQYELVGALLNVIVAPEQPGEVIDALADPDTHIISFTITEKGYLRSGTGELDWSHPDVSHDLSGEGDPKTIYGFLQRGLAKRRAEGGTGLTLLCCDNLAGNGTLLSSLLVSYLRRKDAPLAAWFEAECTCPSTMVDRIVPATTEIDIDAAEAACGVRDEGLVVTEAFRQWVIEDRFAGPRPDWGRVGAQLVEDVDPYETAKLRMLNGAHSALAYIGLDRGHEFVHQAIADGYLRDLVVRLMKDEAAPSIEAAEGQDLDAYADALVERFENPALNHRLAQIAMDGSQKIPQRWLATLHVAQMAGRNCPAILTALAHWLFHVRGDKRVVVDPLVDQLSGMWSTQSVDGVLSRCFGENGLIGSDWVPTDDDLRFVTSIRDD